jgi:hypothetical protein
VANGSIGDAFIDVHANTGPFNRELDDHLERAADDAEGELNRTGRGMGDKISDGIVDSLKRRGKMFAKAIGDGTRNTVVRVRSIFRFDQIRDSIRRRFRRDVGDTITEEIRDSLDRSARSGVFNKIGLGIADAIGAGFNVSGRSPLIAALLPALAALVGVILAAVQAANALVAVLFIIPGLLASIGLQVGVIAIAFNGMGKAIQGAFAAKNAKELRLALKGLSPSARDFVRELLPLRNLFREIGRVVQQNFFLKLTGVITAIRKSLGPSLIKGFGQLASAMGQFFEDFGLLLASPGFKNFFNSIIPATARWLDKFGMSLFGRRGFVTALIAMATELMPFMEKFGDIVLRNLDRLSGLMFQLTTNPATNQWLDDMAATLQLVFDLLFKVGEFLFVFLDQLNRAGGATVIEILMEALSELMFVLSSPVGQKAMEGLVNLGIIGIRAFVGLVVAILGVLAALEAFGEWFRVTGGPFVLDVLRAIGQAAVDMATFLGVWIERIIKAIGGFFVWLWNIITTTKNNFSSLTSGAAAMASSLLARIKAIPGQVLGALGNFASLLYNSGRALIQGLIDGIRSKIQPLLDVLGWIGGRIGGFFGNSPAIYGPLSKRGWTKFRGQNIMKGLISGIRMELPPLLRTVNTVASNINFLPRSVQVNFQGTAVPTEIQARTVGSAVGTGAANMIAARNTRLAVRTL